MVLIGVDLAWGDRRADGVCILKATRSAARVKDFAYPRGDDQLLDALRPYVNGDVFVTIDAPLVVPNRTGSRPVDRQTHALFHREHAGCYPANAERCARPARLLRTLRPLGLRPGWDLGARARLVAEVYPHPALVRFLRLSRIIKYKRGPVRERRREFRRLQHALRGAIGEFFPTLVWDSGTEQVLSRSWTKQNEDFVDAFVCALIGLWHWMHHGRRSQILGNRRTGFILLPEELRQCDGRTHAHTA
jgi:predicted RNase H-like nuclease